MKKGKIGIITGAGPEAGIDLWQKILEYNKSKYSNNFKGDIDAPEVIVHSIPYLGNVMEIELYENEIWDHLKSTILKLDKNVDYFCIACNVLHFYSSKISQLNLSSKFVSIITATNNYLKKRNLQEVAILSIPPIIEFRKYSPYSNLLDNYKIEVPNSKEINSLINNVKKNGADTKNNHQYSKITKKLKSETVILACTELPLLSTTGIQKTFIDPTSILAKSIVNESLHHNH